MILHMSGTATLVLSPHVEAVEKLADHFIVRLCHSPHPASPMPKLSLCDPHIKPNEAIITQPRGVGGGVQFMQT